MHIDTISEECQQEDSFKLRTKFRYRIQLYDGCAKLVSDRLYTSRSSAFKAAGRMVADMENYMDGMEK